MTGQRAELGAMPRAWEGERTLPAGAGMGGGHRAGWVGLFP